MRKAYLITALLESALLPSSSFNLFACSLLHGTTLCNKVFVALLVIFLLRRIRCIHAAFKIRMRLVLRCRVKTSDLPGILTKPGIKSYWN